MPGFYRKVPENTPGAVWEEGCGWIIYDAQALQEGQAAADRITKTYWQGIKNDALAKLAQAELRLKELA